MMYSDISLRWVVLAILCASAGCGSAPGPDEKTNPDPAPSNSTQGLFVTGKVTMPDGRTPPTGDIKDIRLGIFGISEAGENITYKPVVKPDGTFRQKVVPGQYSFDYGTIVMIFNNTVEITHQLEPVGMNWNKRRDAADQITQDFLFRPTGPTAYGKSEGLNSHNATHWHGMSVGMRWQTFRSDLNQPATAPPDGTKLIFTCTPKSKALDGSDVKPFTREMTFKAKDIEPNDDLHDLPPASYEITGVAQLPDGTSKPLVFQGKGDYPRYVKALQAPLEKDSSSNGFFKLLAGFGFE